MQSDFLNHMMVILLVVTCILVLFTKMRLPSVLGYIAVGVVAGPGVLGILSTQEETEFLSEIGIILMMFMIGLEFSWAKLRQSLKMVVGVGTACVVSVTAIAALVSVQLGPSFPAAFLIGGAVAMASTAVVSKQLIDQKEFYDSHGKIAFGILLFQDFATLFFLAAIPAMAHGGNGGMLLYDLAVALFTAFAVLAGLYFTGQKLERPVMRFVSALKSNEIFILTTLLVVMGAAWVSEFFHLPMAIGAFLAGMALGETEFKYKIEEDIRPFRDILVGIFFIVMGLTLKLGAVIPNLALIFSLLLAIFAVKFVITAAIVFTYRPDLGNSLRIGIVLSNCGEFSLLLVMLGIKHGIIESALGDVLMITLVLSLVISTVLVFYNRVIAFFLLSLFGRDHKTTGQNEGETGFKNMSDHIILCGFGETGRAFADILSPVGVHIIAIDVDPQRVEVALALGYGALYGDATSLRTLKSANIGKARAVVLTIEDYAQTMRTLHKVRSEYSDLPIIARVHRASQIEDAHMLGVSYAFSDGLRASPDMQREIMEALHIPDTSL